MNFQAIQWLSRMAAANDRKAGPYIRTANPWIVWMSLNCQSSAGDNSKEQWEREREERGRTGHYIVG